MDRLRSKIYILILISISVFPILSLFHSGLPLTHDGQDHVVRITNFYQNLSEGNIIPRWAGNLNWGYGHPILEFLYPFPSYIASLFHFLGFSLVNSAKIIYSLGMALSLIFMFMWLSQFSSKYGALFGAVLYTYAPYRFVDLYVRGDIGENLAFAFVPLVHLFIYKIYKEKNINNVFLGAIALALLILSHNAISLMFLPFILFYIFYLFWQSKFNRYFILNTLYLILLGFSLSAFFWIPGLFEAKYTLRNIVTAGGYMGRFVNFKDLIYGPWSYGGSGQFTVQLGILHWAGLVGSILLLLKLYRNRSKKEVIVFISGLIFYTLIAIFLMLSISNFIWSRIMLLQNFQFPWRFLSITIFTTSVLGAFTAEKISQKYQAFSLVLFIVLILVLNKDYMKPKAYLYKPESFYTGIYKSTTDTGESSPIWSIRFMERRPKAHLEVIDGNAKITEIKRISTYHAYNAKVKKKTLFAENTLYFPGWQIRANNNPVKIEYQNQQYRGIMLFYLDKGNYKIESLYKETKLRAFADAVSIVVIFNMIGFLLFKLNKFVKARFS